jgi:hypothetical protein
MDDVGRSNNGKCTFFTNDEFPTMEPVPVITVLEKKFHGIRPTRINIGNRRILLFGIKMVKRIV